MKILICGKGGCGKSTVAALLAAAMNHSGKRVLLIDADESNIGLYRMLGLDVPEPLLDSLGGKKGFQEKTKTTGIPLGGPSSPFPRDVRIDELPEGCTAALDGIRIMSVGKIHHYGEGCACPMGKLFRLLFSSLRLAQEDRVIVDTAAGVEHFGRSLDGQCDQVLCVVDPSYESIMMAKRVAAFAEEARLPMSVVLNRVTPEVDRELDAALDGVAVIGRLPDSRSIFMNTLKGRPLELDMPETAALSDALEKAWRRRSPD